MSSSEHHEKNPERVAAGLKASIHNPHVSKEAKESAAEKLQQLEKQQQRDSQPETGHVLGGYKATLSNQKTSEEAKAHAREILSAAGYNLNEDTADEEHDMHVMAGYKAALTNPNVSEGAKQHAREFLKEHHAL